MPCNCAKCFIILSDFYRINSFYSNLHTQLAKKKPHWLLCFKSGRTKCNMKKLKKWLTEAKAILNPKNVYGSQFPLIFSLCCSGLVPYKVVDQNLKSTKKCYFIAGINQILFAYAFIVTIMSNTSFIECFFKTDISKVGNKLHFVVSIVSMVIIYVSCFSQRKQIKKSFRSSLPNWYKIETVIIWT